MQTRAVRSRSRRPFRSLSPSFSSLSCAWVFFSITSSIGCLQTARSSLVHSQGPTVRKVSPLELGLCRLKGHVVRSQHIEVSRRWTWSFARSSKARSPNLMRRPWTPRMKGVLILWIVLTYPYRTSLTDELKEQETIPQCYPQICTLRGAHGASADRDSCGSRTWLFAGRSRACINLLGTSIWTMTAHTRFPLPHLDRFSAGCVRVERT